MIRRARREISSPATNISNSCALRAGIAADDLAPSTPASSKQGRDLPPAAQRAVRGGRPRRQADLRHRRLPQGLVPRLVEAARGAPAAVEDRGLERPDRDRRPPSLVFAGEAEASRRSSPTPPRATRSSSSAATARRVSPSFARTASGTPTACCFRCPSCSCTARAFPS